MPDDLPDLYDIDQIGRRRCAVTYKPDDTPACIVDARPGEPDEDAKYRASMIAGAMNATVDMTPTDIRELLSAYEQVHGRRHHADWRDGADGGDGRTDADVYQDDVRALLDALDLGTHARPVSPHMVVQDEVLPAVRKLKRAFRDLCLTFINMKTSAKSRMRDMQGGGGRPQHARLREGRYEAATEACQRARSIAESIGEGDVFAAVDAAEGNDNG
jgi:hypothetical protein